MVSDLVCLLAVVKQLLRPPAVLTVKRPINVRKMVVGGTRGGVEGGQLSMKLNSSVLFGLDLANQGRTLSHAACSGSADERTNEQMALKNFIVGGGATKE